MPDDNLRLCIEEIAAVSPQKSTSLNCSLNHLKHPKARKISSAVGLNMFPSLENLDLSQHQIKTLNLRDLFRLKSVNLSNNQLKSIRFEEDNKIKHLDLSANQLSHINLQQLPQLDYLDISSNPITELDFSVAENIKTLKLKPLNFDPKVRQKLMTMVLQKLGPTMNVFTDPSIKQCVTESYLREAVPLNQLSELSCLNHPKINNIQGIEQLIALASMTLSDVDTLIDFTYFKELQQLEIHRSNLGYIDLTNATQLRKLRFEDVTAVKVILPVLKRNESDRNISQNPDLSAIETFTDVTYKINNSAIKTLTTRGNCHFNKLSVTESQLEEFEVGQNCVIRDLNLSRNNLTELNTSGLTGLRKLKVTSNKLKSLDLNHLYTLSDLSIQDNKITQLELNPAVQLKRLNIALNPIKFSEIKRGKPPQQLIVSKDQITSQEKQILSKDYRTEEQGDLIRFTFK